MQPGYQPQPVKYNGISVGSPKVFDNRSLTIMLESLQEALRGVQVVDQKSLATAFGMMQGYQSRDVTRGFTVLGSPTPQIVATDNTGSSESRTEGKEPTSTTGSTSSTQTQTTTASRVPAIPWESNLPQAPAFTPQFGAHASDLLSDQVNLTYQIFNIRMLLDRSLSDRLLFSSEKTTRVQAVLGFNVTLEPPPDAARAAAVVEVTITPDEPAQQERVSLVAVMPQEKTYNSAALSQSSNAFGGAAVAGMFNVGYGERRRGQTFYLYRDSDTIAYEKMSDPSSNETVFGWQFRPVLGRKSVAAGTRQMFAVISLPMPDPADNDTGGSSTESLYKLRATVRTFWRQHNGSNLTTAHWDGAGPLARFRQAARRVPYVATVGTQWRPSERRRVDLQSACVLVPRTARFQTDLEPRIDKVTWYSVGASGAVVSIRGSNFFTGTKVAFGGKILDSPATGLTITSEKAMEILTDRASIARADGVVIGRYGASKPLTSLRNVAEKGIKIESVNWGKPLGGFYEIWVRLAAADGKRLTIDDLDSDSMPVLTVNGTPVSGPYEFQDYKGVKSAGSSGNGGQKEEDPAGDRVYIVARVPEDVATRGVSGVISVRFPFKSAAWSSSLRAYEYVSAFGVSRFGETGVLVEKKDGDIDNPFTSGGFEADISGQPLLKIEKKPCGQTLPRYCALSDVLSLLTLKDAKDVPKTFLLATPDGAQFTLNVPPAEAPLKKPKVNGDQKQSVDQFDAVWLSFGGENLKSLGQVTANGLVLETNVSSEKEDKIEVYLLRTVTDKPAELDLVFRDKQGAVAGKARVSVRARPAQKESGQ